MASCSSSIIGVSSIYQTLSSELPRRATSAPALSLPFAAEKYHFNGLKASSANFCPKQLAGCGVTGGPSSVATTVASPNFSLLREDAFKGLEGFGDSDSVYESEADELESSSGVAFSVDELSISNLGLPKRLVDSLENQGITELFPIQVRFLGIGGESGNTTSGSGNDGATQSAESGSECSSDGSDDNQEFAGSERANIHNNTCGLQASVPGIIVSTPTTNLNIVMD